VPSREFDLIVRTDDRAEVRGFEAWVGAGCVDGADAAGYAAEESRCTLEGATLKRASTARTAQERSCGPSSHDSRSRRDGITTSSGHWTTSGRAGLRMRCALRTRLGCCSIDRGAMDVGSCRIVTPAGRSSSCLIRPAKQHVGRYANGDDHAIRAPKSW